MTSHMLFFRRMAGAARLAKARTAQTPLLTDGRWCRRRHAAGSGECGRLNGTRQTWREGTPSPRGLVKPRGPQQGIVTISIEGSRCCWWRRCHTVRGRRKLASQEIERMEVAEHQFQHNQEN